MRLGIFCTQSLYNLIFVCMKALTYIFWALSQDESFCLFLRLHGALVFARTKERPQSGTTSGILNHPPPPPPSLMPGHLSCLPGGAHPQTRAPHLHRVRCQGQCHLESEKSHLGPCPDQLFIALEKRWAWDISISTGALRHAFVTTGWDRCIVLDGHTPTLGLCED